MMFKFLLKDCRLCKRTFLADSKKQRCCDDHNDIYKKFVKQASKEAEKLGINDLTAIIDRKFQTLLEEQALARAVSDFKKSG